MTTSTTKKEAIQLLAKTNFANLDLTTAPTEEVLALFNGLNKAIFSRDEIFATDHTSQENPELLKQFNRNILALYFKLTDHRSPELLNEVAQLYARTIDTKESILDLNAILLPRIKNMSNPNWSDVEPIIILLKNVAQHTPRKIAINDQQYVPSIVKLLDRSTNALYTLHSAKGSNAKIYQETLALIPQFLNRDEPLSLSSCYEVLGNLKKTYKELRYGKNLKDTSVPAVIPAYEEAIETLPHTIALKCTDKLTRANSAIDFKESLDIATDLITKTAQKDIAITPDTLQTLLNPIEIKVHYFINYNPEALADLILLTSRPTALPQEINERIFNIFHNNHWSNTFDTAKLPALKDTYALAKCLIQPGTLDPLKKHLNDFVNQGTKNGKPTPTTRTRQSILAHLVDHPMITAATEDRATLAEKNALLVNAITKLALNDSTTKSALKEITRIIEKNPNEQTIKTCYTAMKGLATTRPESFTPDTLCVFAQMKPKEMKAAEKQEATNLLETLKSSNTPASTQAAIILCKWNRTLPTPTQKSTYRQSLLSTLTQ